MFDIYVWITIALIGLAIYILPAWNVQRAYEGFQTAPPSFDLKDLEAMLATPLADKSPVTSGIFPLPQEFSSAKSQPGSPDEKPKASVALAQGQALQTTVPKLSVPETAASPKVLVKKEYVQVPVPTKCPPPPKCPPTPKCPPQRICPPQAQCPDMSQYIRKDSIPCWGCKLK